MVYEATAKGLESSTLDVCRQIDDHFFHWEGQEISRLQSIVDLAETPDCIEQKILTYFGEDSPPCGRCSSCRGEGGQALVEGNGSELGLEELKIIREMVAEKHIALNSPRQLARFLSGLTSPATTRARLTTKHDRFAVFEDYLFSDILLNCEVVMGG